MLIMELVKSVRAWFKKDVVYEKVRPGFHPYLQTDTSYSAHPREIDPCHQPDFMVADVDLPAWSSILSLYPDLTSDPGFDQRKLGRSFLNYLT